MFEHCKMCCLWFSIVCLLLSQNSTHWILIDTDAKWKIDGNVWRVTISQQHLPLIYDSDLVWWSKWVIPRENKSIARRMQQNPPETLKTPSTDCRTLSIARRMTFFLYSFTLLRLTSSFFFWRATQFIILHMKQWSRPELSFNSIVNWRMCLLIFGHKELVTHTQSLTHNGRKSWWSKKRKSEKKQKLNSNCSDRHYQHDCC